MKAAPRPSPNQAMQPTAVSLRGLTQRFRTAAGSYIAIQDIDLDVRPGCFVSLVGPSGCGKSTVLNLVAGLMTPTEGAIEVFGDPLRGLNRRASYMFQQDGLLAAMEDCSG